MLALSLIAASLLPSIESSFTEEQSIRRIQAHLLLNDPHSALEESTKALDDYPQSHSLHEANMRALAKLGNETMLLHAWDNYANQFPDFLLNRPLIEEIAWGIIQKASLSSSIVMRQMALLAAFFSQQSQSMAIIKKAMHDSNYAIRQMAVKLAGNFRDQKLVDEVKRLLKEEKVWAVRKEVLKAIGKMKIASLKQNLEALIAQEDSLPKEKTLAIASLLEILNSVNRNEIEKLSLSNRAGLRHLSCQAIAHFHSLRDLDLLFRLAHDPHSEVRMAALQALGQIRPHVEKEKIVHLARQGSKDSNYKVALSAIWLLTLYEQEEGQRKFEPYFKDKRRGVRVFAASALGATGQYGLEALLCQMRNQQDPYVRLNLALALIGQRHSTKEAAEQLSQIVMEEKRKWSWTEEGIFRAIGEQPGKRNEEAETSPETDDLLVRLELLNLLAILKDPLAQKATCQFLNERSWEIAGTASLLLLKEGNEEAIEIVQQLMKNSQTRVRLQAAFILSLWSRDESAIQVLEEGYLQSGREMKTRIIEALGRIGSMRSIPFLIHVLKEPSQTLRLIAAMALIQCLNH